MRSMTALASVIAACALLGAAGLAAPGTVALAQEAEQPKPVFSRGF